MSWNINCARLLCHRQIFKFPSCCSIIGMQLLAHIALATQMPLDSFFNRFESLPLCRSSCYVFFFFFISFHSISNEIQWNKNQIIPLKMRIKWQTVVERSTLDKLKKKWKRSSCKIRPSEKYLYRDFLGWEIWLKAEC